MSEGSSWRLLIRRQSSWLPAAAALTTMTYQNRFLAASPRRPKTSPFKSRVLGGPSCSTRRLSPSWFAVTAPRDRTAENQRGSEGVAWQAIIAGRHGIHDLRGTQRGTGCQTGLPRREPRPMGGRAPRGGAGGGGEGGAAPPAAAAK